jgi:pyrophosphatase PpaX
VVVNKPYRVAFYDWDGCIAKTLDVWIAATKKVLAQEGLHAKDEEIVSLFGDWNALQLLGYSDLERAVAQFLEYLRTDLKTVKMYPNALQTLTTLCERGIKLAVLSTSRRESIEATSIYTAINKCVKFFITADDVEYCKPHPESIQTALTKLKARPNEAVIIGDTEKDILAAQNAGIDSILFAPSEHANYYDLTRLRALNPTHSITDHKAILDLV